MSDFLHLFHPCSPPVPAQVTPKGHQEAPVLGFATPPGSKLWVYFPHVHHLRKRVQPTIRRRGLLGVLSLNHQISGRLLSFLFPKLRHAPSDPCIATQIYWVISGFWSQGPLLSTCWIPALTQSRTATQKPYVEASSKFLATNFSRSPMGGLFCFC